MSAFIIFIIIAIVSFLIVLVLYSMLTVSKRSDALAERDYQNHIAKKNIKKNKETSNNSLVLPPITITFQVYNDLFLLFKTMLQYVTTIEELDKLIEQKAELPANFLLEKVELSRCEYTSAENIEYWRNSYFRQLELQFHFARDIFNMIKESLPDSSKKCFTEQLGYIGYFIDLDK